MCGIFGIIVNKEEAEKQYRATQVIELIGIPADDMAVLDFGCGKGFLLYEMKLILFFITSSAKFAFSDKKP